MDPKKKAAAAAAVYAYITDGEDVFSRQTGDSSETGFSSRSRQGMSGQGPNIWGQTGRQFMMQANTMMQLRMFK